MKNFWIGTGKENGNDVGVEVEADNLTIEISGAISLWSAPPDSPFQPKLVMAFGPGHWTWVHIIDKKTKEIAGTLTPTT